MQTIDGGDAAGLAAKKKCFVVSPIGSKDSPERTQADRVLKHIIKRALETDYDVERADDSANPGAITSRIVASIRDADLIVADISGGNANVFYELAIAHGYDIPTVHIQNSGNKIPFDIQDMSVIDYDLTDPDSVETAQGRVLAAATFAVARPTEIETPLKGAQNFKQVTTSKDPNAHVSAKILEEVQKVREMVARNSPNPLSDDMPMTSESDGKAYRTIITRAGKNGRLEASDVQGVLSPTTSVKFDEFAIRVARNLLKTSDNRTIRTHVYDEVMLDQNPHLVDDDPDDEPPF